MQYGSPRHRPDSCFAGQRQAGESFASSGGQRDRIVGAYARDGLELLETTDELDVSSGKPLAERAGLCRAVEAIEAGRAEFVVAAYFDRLVVHA